MRKSIFTELFYLCAAVFLAAVVCICAVLLFVSCECYKAEKRDYMTTITENVIGEIVSYAEGPQTVNREKIRTAFTKVSDFSGINYTLVNSDGVALVCSEASPCLHTDKKLGAEQISRITENGLYELSTFNDYYDEDYFHVSYKISLNGVPFYLLGTVSVNSFNNYFLNLIIILVTVTAIITAAVFLILYAATKRMLTPIKEMTVAARRFGEGDFSKKLRISDENELGYLANSLNEMASSLQEIELTRKTFVSNVSHELKTPMTSIGGFIDGILDGTIPEEQHEHYLRIVSSEVERLARLVRSMLNISKYEAGELTLSTENFDMLPVIVNTLMNFEKRIEEKHIDIRGLDTTPVCVNADIDLIKQVVYNLTENAVKFVNEGGYIEFEFAEKEDMCSILIRNSGEGLKENEISKVFERFYKTDESRGIDPGGVGLGLPLVRSLIKLHGGTILVRSEPDRYTEFEFTLKKASC